jgi:hypothetical protein
MILMGSLRNGDMKCTSPSLHFPSLRIHSGFRNMIIDDGCRWFFSEKRIVYKIHGGPMAGRVNYQTASYQCIRPGELWQCNWLEGSSPPHPHTPCPPPLFLLSKTLPSHSHKITETGTICSLVYDIPNNKISTLLAFSQGHWEHPQEAHGDKRNPADFQRWRGLAAIGKQTDRFMLNEQADILEAFKGKGDLVPIDPEAETL